MEQLENRSAVIADEHPLWLGALKDLLHEAGVEVVGQATSPTDTVALVSERQPDILVLGIEFADDRMDGQECLRQAVAAAPDIKSIVVSSKGDIECIEAAFTDGASAFCIKSAAAADLAAAVRQSFHHSIYLAHARPFTADPPETVATDRGPVLTRREVEILRLMAEGHSNAQLASMLWVTEQTVKFHLSNVYRKLEVGNRTEASRWAQRHGLLAETSAEAVRSTTAA
jgi:NarL family two-component system response regulator LiaR